MLIGWMARIKLAMCSQTPCYANGNSRFKDVNELAEWLSWTERSERLRKSCVRIGQKKSAEIDEDSLG